MKICKAEGHGQSACRRCTELGKYSWTWTSFLYKIEGINGYFCYECTKEIEKEGIQLTIDDLVEQEIKKMRQ